MTCDTVSAITDIHSMCFSLIRISHALDVLVKHKRIDFEMASQVKEFLETNPARIPITKLLTDERTSKINEVKVDLVMTSPVTC